jgi:hypothetical protein
MVQGTYFHSGYDTPPTDPLAKAFDIIEQYRPTSLVPFTPESLRLEIYAIDSIDDINPAIDVPTPSSEELFASALDKYGFGSVLITGDEVDNVMEEFEALPDLKILRHLENYIAAAICADFHQ